MFELLVIAVALLAIGFVALVLILNAHLKQLRREFQDLRTFLVAILGER